MDNWTAKDDTYELPSQKCTKDLGPLVKIFVAGNVSNRLGAEIVEVSSKVLGLITESHSTL